MAPMGYSASNTASYDYSGNNADWSSNATWWRMPPRRVRRRNACKTCWKAAGWPDRKDLEWFQYQSGRPVHMAESGDNRLLCGRVR